MQKETETKREKDRERRRSFEDFDREVWYLKSIRQKDRKKN